ncbi:MAG: YfbM family protein [Ferruginibacter sp.]
MSMIGKFVRVTENELQNYISDSLLFENLLDDEAFDEGQNVCDIDKTWDAISYLLTGYGPSDLNNAKPPISWTIFGSSVLDENQDLGYGPGNYLTVEQVALVNAELSKISLKDLMVNYNADKMNDLGLYPNSWGKPEDEMDYIGNHFESLKIFYLTAAANEQAVICYLS